MNNDAYLFTKYSTGDISEVIPDSKGHGANMGPIWGRQDPDGPNVGPINFVIWVCYAPNPMSHSSEGRT